MAIFKRVTWTAPLGVIGVGMLFFLCNWVASRHGYYFPAMMAACPAIFFGGIAMLLFPATEPPAELAPALRQKHYFMGASFAHKMIWGLGVALGAGAGIAATMSYGAMLA